MTRPGECWFDDGAGNPLRVTMWDAPPLVGLHVGGRPVLWVDDEFSQFMADGGAFAQRIIEMLRPGLYGGSRRSIDQSTPDTSQEYFLDLIAQIDDATGDE